MTSVAGVMAVVLGAGCSFEIPATGPAAGDGSIGEPGSDAAIDAAVDAATDAPRDAPGPSSAVLLVLNGQQWLIPCLVDLGNRNCTSPLGVITRSVTVGGSASEHWLVTLRIRGAMEAITYVGGTSSGMGWHVGGIPGDTGNNYYKLEVSQPAGTYWLNEGTPTSRRSFRYDYMVDVPIDGGATVFLRSSGQDDRQWGNYDQNGNPIVIAGVTTTPSPYNGQFAQLDVVSAILQ